MSKPNWECAPDWANFAAMDKDGSWYFYECMPSLGRMEWNSQGLSGGRVQRSEEMDWESSLESRP